MEDAPKYDKARIKRIGTQFIKFGIVGASGVIVNTIVMVIMHHFHGGMENASDPIWNIPFTDFWIRYRNIVYIVSFVIANAWNYQINRTWTFKGTKRSWASGFFSFLAVGAVGAVVGLLVQVALTHADSPLYLPDSFFTAAGGWRSRELWAQLIGVLISTPINFVVNKLWTFRQHAPVQKEVPSSAAVD